MADSVENPNQIQEVCPKCHGFLNEYGDCFVEQVWSDYHLDTDDDIECPCDTIHNLRLMNNSKQAELDSYYDEKAHYIRQIEESDAAHKELHTMQTLVAAYRELDEVRAIYESHAGHFDWRPSTELIEREAQAKEVLRDNG